MNSTAYAHSSRYKHSMTLMNMVSSLTGFMSKKTTNGMFLPKSYFFTKPICHWIMLWSGSHFLQLITNVDMKLILLQDGRCRCFNLDYPTSYPCPLQVLTTASWFIPIGNVPMATTFLQHQSPPVMIRPCL
jgi:hypothetical protein